MRALIYVIKHRLYQIVYKWLSSEATVADPTKIEKDSSQPTDVHHSSISQLLTIKLSTNGLVVKPR